MTRDQAMQLSVNDRQAEYAAAALAVKAIEDRIWDAAGNLLISDDAYTTEHEHYLDAIHLRNFWRDTMRADGWLDSLSGSLL